MILEGRARRRYWKTEECRSAAKGIQPCERPLVPCPLVSRSSRRATTITSRLRLAGQEQAHGGGEEILADGDVRPLDCRRRLRSGMPPSVLAKSVGIRHSMFRYREHGRLSWSALAGCKSVS